MSVPTLWVYLDDEGGRVPELPGRMAAEARRFSRISGLSPGGLVRSRELAEQLGAAGACTGMDTLHVLPGAPRPAVAAIAERIGEAVASRQPELILFPATALGADLGARAAAHLGCAFLSRCVDLDWQDGRPVARRAVYHNRAHQVLRPTGGAPWIATIDPQVLEATPVAPEAAAPPVEVLNSAAAGRDDGTPAEIWRVPSRELDVADADVVLSVGRGVGTAQILAQVHELAELLGAAVGGSREAVFAGMIPRDRQVGASGKWIAPRIYVALGISGSTYHMMGIREAKHVVAVNLDAGAPIFDRAEIRIVDDVATIVPALTAAVAGRAGT